MEPSQSSRARLYFAAVLAASLAAVALVVVLARAGGGEGPVAADPACIEAWNEDRGQVALGIHQFNGHGYSRVQVLRVDERAQPVDGGEKGFCAAVFAAQALDPEPAAAAQVLRDGRWVPLSSFDGVGSGRLGELQSDAVSRVNATLSTGGELAPVPAEDRG